VILQVIQYLMLIGYNPKKKYTRQEKQNFLHLINPRHLRIHFHQNKSSIEAHFLRIGMVYDLIS